MQIDNDINRAAALFETEALPTAPVPAQPEDADWASRGDQLREAEWQNVHKSLVLLRRLALRTALHQLTPRPAETARLLEAFAKVGRLCTGLNTDPDSQDNFEPPPLPLVLKEAIERIYGQPPTPPEPPHSVPSQLTTDNQQLTTHNSPQ